MLSSYMVQYGKHCHFFPEGPVLGFERSVLVVGLDSYSLDCISGV